MTVAQTALAQNRRALWLRRIGRILVTIVLVACTLVLIAVLEATGGRKHRDSEG